MPSEFQRAMDSILSKFPHSHAFIDDILIVTKGSESDHVGIVEKILRKLDWKNMPSKLTKSKFAQKSSECLGLKLHKTSQMLSGVGKTRSRRVENYYVCLKVFECCGKSIQPKNLKSSRWFGGRLFSKLRFGPEISRNNRPKSLSLSLEPKKIRKIRLCSVYLQDG